LGWTVTIEAEALKVPAPAKINLFLHVGDRRTDGFHALQSLVVFAAFGDELVFSPDRDLKLVARGPFAGNLGSSNDNLVIKAAKALQKHTCCARGAYISLKKNLPVASGIGGGSADAAAALRGLSRLWRLTLPADELRMIAAELGSDVPACVASMPQWMEGRGEKLAVLDGIPAMPMVLVNPGLGLSTGEVFAALKVRRGTQLPPPPNMQAASDLVAYLKDTANDLEAPARAIAPSVGEVLDALASQHGVLLSRMSGSGATCFALFDSDDSAAMAALIVGEQHRNWWVTATKTASLPRVFA
jgi:4-diphosphocytidyl-2-C-methyl-D-erythritol kinase